MATAFLEHCGTFEVSYRYYLQTMSQSFDFGGLRLGQLSGFPLQGNGKTFRRAQAGYGRCDLPSRGSHHF